MDTCEYEQLRRKNLEDNKRILAELGLSNPYNLLPKVIKKGVKRPSDNEEYRPKKKAKVLTAADIENSGSIRGTRRLSARLRGQVPGTECVGEDDEVESEHEQKRTKYQYVMPDRPNWYGEVPGVEVGTIWMMRIDCCRDGIHRPTVAGIHGGPEGAYSLALSGGYEDDIDLGDCFTYTGEGGRDLKGTKNNPKNLRTAPQSKDQELTRGNLALSRSVETGNPVRVIRGYKLRSPFAPDEGYRYDGLYTVEKFWFTQGLSKFGVYKFALRRCKNQAPLPWELSTEAMSPSKSSDSGFSDATNCDRDSNDGQKSEAGDSDLSPHSPGTSEAADSETNNSEAADSEPTNSEAADTKLANREAADSNLANSETANSKPTNTKAETVADKENGESSCADDTNADSPVENSDNLNKDPNDDSSKSNDANEETPKEN